MNSDYVSGQALDQAWDFSDPVGSEERLRALQIELGPDSVAGAEVATQIARALGLQGRFAEGHAVLDSMTSNDLMARTRVALERGRLINSGGDPAGAIPLFRDAADLAAGARDAFLQVDALHMLAIVDSAGAEQWTDQAIDIAASTEDLRTRRWLGALYNNRGWGQHESGRHDEALETFRAALNVYEATGSPTQIHIAHWSVARCLRSLGQFEAALTIQLRLQQADEPDPYVDEEIAELNKALADAAGD